MILIFSGQTVSLTEIEWHELKRLSKSERDKMSLTIRNCFSFFLTLFIFCAASTRSVGAEKKQEKPKKKTPHHVLWIMDADGSHLKELFTSSQYTSLGSPAFSPDGSKIAMDGWESHNGNKNGRDAHILVINADGTNMKDLGDGAMPSWSADGKRFCFSRYSPYGVWLMNTDGTGREELYKSGWGAQWSPDGKKIVYSVYLNGPNLMIYDPQEETFRYVFPAGEAPFSQFYWNSCWSPDSKSICIKAITKLKEMQLITIDIDRGLNGIKVQYSVDKKRPAEDNSWHPSGKFILTTIHSPTEDTKQFYWIDPTQKQKPHRWKPGQNIEWPRDICWSPDGKKLVFTTPED